MSRIVLALLIWPIAIAAQTGPACSETERLAGDSLLPRLRLPQEFKLASLAGRYDLVMVATQGSTRGAELRAQFDLRLSTLPQFVFGRDGRAISPFWGGVTTDFTPVTAFAIPRQLAPVTEEKPDLRVGYFPENATLFIGFPANPVIDSTGRTGYRIDGPGVSLLVAVVREDELRGVWEAGGLRKESTSGYFCAFRSRGAT